MFFGGAQWFAMGDRSGGCDEMGIVLSETPAGESGRSRRRSGAFLEQRKRGVFFGSGRDTAAGRKLGLT